MIPQALFSNRHSHKFLVFTVGKNVLKHALPHSQHHLLEDGEASWEKESVGQGHEASRPQGPLLTLLSGLRSVLCNWGSTHISEKHSWLLTKKKAKALGRKSSTQVLWGLQEIIYAGQMLLEESPFFLPGLASIYPPQHQLPLNQCQKKLLWNKKRVSDSQP